MRAVLDPPSSRHAFLLPLDKQNQVCQSFNRPRRRASAVQSGSKRCCKLNSGEAISRVLSADLGDLLEKHLWPGRCLPDHWARCMGRCRSNNIARKQYYLEPAWQQVQLGRRIARQKLQDQTPLDVLQVPAKTSCRPRDGSGSGQQTTDGQRRDCSTATGNFRAFLRRL